MVVVEPVLTEEKLRELLAEGHEESALDYKQVLDLNERRDIVELAKDLGAMQAERDGGYIVVGVDDNGKVLGLPGESHARLFDEATVRSKMLRYMAEPLDLRVAVHPLAGGKVALVYVGSSPNGWCIFKAEGSYEPSPGRTVVVFRPGDVFVRHGTASERWTPADAQRVLERAIASRKESWRVELREELAAMTSSSLDAQRIETLSSDAVTWQLDAEGFDALVTELLRRNDDIPLRRLLARLPAEAEQVRNSQEDLGTLLDRLASLAGLALDYERHSWFKKAVQALVRIYDLGFDGRGLQRGVEAARLWLVILDRVYALGGLAVRLEDWAAVRYLANRKGSGHDFDHYPSWLRHGLTMAARAQLMETEAQAGLLARANNVVRSVDALHPDLPGEDERILNSLCQFDALVALVAIDETGRVNTSYYYPNFARYHTMRTEPAFMCIITDPQMRGELFKNDDHLLAQALEDVTQSAFKEGFRYNGWDGLESQVVGDFIRANI